MLASLLIERNEFADAELLLIGLLRDYPRTRRFLWSLFEAHVAHAAPGEGRAARTRGIALRPRDRECLLAAALCETARSGARPNEGLAKLLTNHPESLSTVHALVVALVDSGRMAEAHRIAQAAMRADPANEHLVNLVRELRIQNHWSMKPLWPMQKWGWGAAAGMWIGAIVMMRFLEKAATAAAVPFAFTWLAYAIYSWVWPPLIRRIL